MVPINPTTDKGLNQILVSLDYSNKVDELFDQINSAEFYFLRKLYSTTLYLLLVAQLKKQNQRHDEQLKALISETGFTKLYTLF